MKTELGNRDFIEFKIDMKRINPELTDEEIQELYTEQLHIDND